LDVYLPYPFRLPEGVFGILGAYFMKNYSLSPPSFQEYIFSWWTQHRRDLPWRKTHDPYKILVSEMMLQQTQVQRVIPKYFDFIRKYPDIESLAQSKTSDIIIAWKGLGYNRRAVYLKRSAEKIHTQYNGVFPENEKDLKSLPGVGDYTARAVLVFAYKWDIGLVDTNIRKIITQYFFKGSKQKESVIRDFADTLVPRGKSWEWHQALMDYGALELGKNSIRIKTHDTKLSTVPFKETNRFLRGKILDLLRVTSISRMEVIQYCQKNYGKTDESINNALKGMIRDNLIESSHGRLRLPAQ